MAQAVSSLSMRRPGFTSGSVNAGFVVDEVEPEQIVLRLLLFSPANIIPPELLFNIIIIWGMYNILVGGRSSETYSQLTDVKSNW
jgi:hypothetical protein